MSKWSRLWPIAAIALCACTSDRLVGRPDLQIADGTDLPPPVLGTVTNTLRPYVIAPNDQLEVNVFGVNELNLTVRADTNGQISLPLAGTLTAAGNTPAQLSAMITDRLRRYVRDPQVTVNAETINQSMAIEGEVRQPGIYPITGRMTLLRAVARAQGLTEDANTSYVVVFRRVGDQDMAALYDLRSIRQGIYPDPEIYPEDTISIGESRGRRIFQLAFQSAAILTAPLVAVITTR